MCRSEWHTPQRSMRTSTSLPCGSGQSTMVSQSGACIGGRARSGGALSWCAFSAWSAQARGRARRNLRPECPRRARSARCRPPRAAAADRTPSVCRLWRSILRRWPNAASVTRSSRRGSQASGSARGTSSHHRRCHFGRRHEGAGATSNRIFASRAPAGQHGQPAVALAAGRGDDAFGHLALEHQHQPVVPRRPRLDGQPARPAARSRCCRAGWRRCARARRQDAARGSNSSASPATISSRPGIARRDLLERGDGAVVALDRDHARARLRRAARG